MVLLESENIELGTAAQDFQNLPGIDGKTHSLCDFDDKKVLIIIFMCNHCPYVQAIFERLVTIQADYGDKGVQIIGINPNDSNNYPEDSMQSMIEAAPKQGVNFIYVRDDSQEVARAYNAQCTPDIFVYGNNRKLVYHGRVDDNWKNHEEVTKNELRDALDLYLENGKMVETQHPSMGCSIKWKN